MRYISVMMRYGLIFVLFFSLYSLEAFEPFTGKVTRSKVRMRLSPDLDGKIIRELPKDDLLIIRGEVEDFYLVSPPEDIKAYVFRTFVLEGLVEGSRVNVRLEPNLDSPIITQLNSGDRVEGDVCVSNNKWYEITPPQSVSFYIYKDFIDNVGDVNYLATVAERRKDVSRLLNCVYEMSQEEMQKRFEEIDLSPIIGIVKELTTEFIDFPDYTKRAKDLLTLIQDHYLQQKADYLEFKTQENSVEWKEKNLQLVAEMESQKERLLQLEKQLEEEKSKASVCTVETEMSDEFTPNTPPSTLQDHLTNWAAVEQTIFEQNHEAESLQEYYLREKEQAKALVGILKPYDRIVKNKPGDYLLVNPHTQMPIAFLYSTDVDLKNKIGEEITVHGSPRPDHHFAFPAYYVHGIE